jgi:tetratricopeptide (TPR) repeat protein
MNVLVMGSPFWAANYPETPWVSPAGHEVRTLAVAGTGCANYVFAPSETAREAIARIQTSWPVDLLYCVTPEHFPPPLAVEACPVKTAAVISDWNLHQPTLEHNLARFDIVFCDRPGVNTLRVKGAALHHAEPIYSHVPAVHYPRDVDRDIDVLFLGNLNHAIHRARGRVLEEIARLSDRYRVVIHGGLPPEEYATMLSRARIAINYGVRHEMNLRCFEAVACGAMLMIEANNEETAEWLTPGEAAVFYEEDQVAEMVTQYLEDETARARIAAEGLRRAPGLAMENRIDTFFALAAAQPRGARVFTAFDAQTQAIATALLYAGSHAEPQRAWALETLPATLTPFDSAAALLTRGSLALDARDVRGALAHFEEAALRAPGDAVPWLQLAQVAQRVGNAPLEKQWLTRATAATSAALAPFFHAPVTNPWFADTRAFLATGKDTLAILHGAAWVRLARLAQLQGSHAEALQLAARAIGTWPWPGEAQRVRGDALAALGKHSESAMAYALAAGSDAFDDAARMGRVKALHAAGETARARAVAVESATLFSACAGGQEIAARFQELAGDSRGNP